MTQNELAVKHIPLVKSIANRFDAPHLKDDLVGEGMIALVKCAEKYDPERGVSFGGYARHEIRGAMIKYLNKNRPTEPLDGMLNTVGSDGQVDVVALRDALRYHLHPVEEWVVVKRYFEKMRMEDIAKELGFKESRVSQIHANAIRKLRRAFASEPSEVEPREESDGPDQPAALLQVVRKMFWDEWGLEVYEG